MARAKGSGRPAKGEMKKMSGKSMAQNAEMPMHKPSMHLDTKQMPKAMQGAKPGDKVKFEVTAKVTHKTESLGGHGGMSMELEKIAVPKAPRGTP